MTWKTIYVVVLMITATLANILVALVGETLVCAFWYLINLINLLTFSLLCLKNSIMWCRLQLDAKLTKVCLDCEKKLKPAEEADYMISDECSAGSSSCTNTSDSDEEVQAKTEEKKQTNLVVKEVDIFANE